MIFNFEKLLGKVKKIISGEQVVGNAKKLDGKAASDFAPSTHEHTKSEITDFPKSMPPEAHNQAASTITAGMFAGQVKANATAQAALTTAQLRDVVFVEEASAPEVGSTADTSKFPEGCFIALVNEV